MQKTFIAIVLALLVLMAPGTLAQKQAPPEGGQPKDFTLPTPKAFTLDNGLSVVLVHYGTVPKVSVRVVVRAGNINEGPNQVWLADMTGDLMKEGTATKTSEQVSKAAAGMGGSVSVNVGPDQTGISGRVLSQFGPDLVALLADVIRHPRLPESELPRLRNDRLRNLTIALADPQQIAGAKFASVLYPDHPYGRYFPTPEMLKSYTIDMVRNYYASNFGAQRTVVYVAGMFDDQKMEEAIRKEFNDWTRGPEPLINVPTMTSKQDIYIIDRPGAPQSVVSLGLPVIDPSQPEYRALLVTNALLGGSFASRITSNIREDKGYTYSPYSMVSSRYRSSYWAEDASVTTAVTGASLKEIFFEINRLCQTPPTAEELKGIQNYLAGVFVLQNSSPDGIISQLAFLRLHGLPDDYLKTYVKAVYDVTPEQVQQIAQKYIKAKEMPIVIVGDRKLVEKQVTPYGHIVK